MCFWKQWKKIRTKHDNLVKLGIGKRRAWEYANTRKSYWHSANSPILSRTLTTEHLRKIGFITVACTFTLNRRIPNGTYGGVRGWGLKAPAYSILEIYK